MLAELRITNLGVIDEAVLEFAPGLTVVTGETGAGKTMVVTGLGLLFGGRADFALVRSGAQRAAVEGRIDLGADVELGERIEELGADLDEDGLLLTRVVGADGRSRGLIGGRSVPVSALAELAEGLIAVHGQSDQIRLKSAARQREALDAYGGEAVRRALAAYVDVYERHAVAQAELATLRDHSRERAREMDVLRFGLDEIAGIAPRPGEDAELAGEISRLSHADLLRGAALAAHAGLLGDSSVAEIPDAVGLLAGARSALERAADHDPVLADLASRLADVGYIVNDLAVELAIYADGVEADPVRLAAAMERQAALASLVRKYAGPDRGGVDAVLAWAGEGAARLDELEGADDRVAELADTVARLHASLTDVAATLTLERQAAATDFAAAVTRELRELAMPHAQLAVEISAADEFGPHGADVVEISLLPHPGAPARPLAKGASGGELSRVMLAVEVVLAGAGDVATFVFDEVDAGVGGRAAAEIGRRLARLARSAQVIVVTHLPQVAAFADRHLVVVKADDGVVTSSGVIELDEEARVHELSRMLAGLDGSAHAHAHATELIESATNFKRAG